uniref:Piezo type mechanosensitive ion channel component 2 n=1 Tax=Cyprinodon variegatus TaxID=28743 RepID=A0A3Q2CZF9_CYPVA
MASQMVCGLIFRLLLPTCLAACLFRYNVLSFVYLIYLLLLPLFPEPTSTTMQQTGHLLQSLCFTSMSFLLLHIIYQITINSLLAGNSISSDFNSVIGADAGNGIRVFIPDIGMFMVGLAIWLLCRSLVQKRPPEEMGEDEEDEEEEEEEEAKESTKMKILRMVAEVASKVKEIIGNLITTAGKVVVTILLGMTIMLPSLTSFVYFSIFLFLCTWWSLCRTFNTLIFSCMCVLMAIFSAGHLVVLYLYQFQFFQESISPNDTYVVFGIAPIVQTNCSCTWKLTVHPDRKWYHFVNPIMLLILYYTLATLIRLWLQEPLKESEDEENDIKKKGVGAMVKFFHFIMKQSYICALIAMMLQAWSITYVSWLTFVFLMWSCVLWMVRDRRRYAMLSSPFMVAYGNLVIVLQYIWSFENMQPVAGFFVTKMMCLVTFWLLLRQTLTERQEKQKEENTGLLDVLVDSQKKEEEKDKEEGGEQDLLHVLGSLVMGVLVKYWIYICGGMFFIVSFEGTIVMYKIIYMMMLLSCVALYQVHYEWWRRILKYFWMTVVMYTMLVLTIIYTFLKDLGLERFSVSMLFTRIFIPTSFLLACILHLHYFHQPFLQLTDLQAVIAKEESTIYRLAEPAASLEDLTMLSASSIEATLPKDKEEKEEEQQSWGSGNETEQALVVVTDTVDSMSDEKPKSFSDQRSDFKNKWHLVVDRLTVLFLKFLEYFHKLQLFIWWLLEIHIIKIVSCYIVMVSLLNVVFLASWAFALPYSQYQPLASSVCTVWTCVIIVCKMLYQLKTNLLMLALLAFEVTIYRHQQYFRLRNKLSPPAARIIFHDITRQHLDIGIVSFVKYFINYFFYKFGLETCLLLVVNIIGQRMDFYAMLHAFALIAVMYRRRRKAIAEIWSKYCFFLASMLTFQYFVCIGIPPADCKYPWRFPNSTTDPNVIKWLYIPDFHTKPNPHFLADFALLLCASLQRQVFDDENKAAVRIMAGDNVEICRDLDAASFSVHNPVPDFIHCSYLDMLKVIMFSYLFWFVLTIIFITGTTRISVFCMGYLVACFYFLLFGGDLLLKPIKKILHYWDFLIAYNIFVITMKNILSILACGYINSLIRNQCWLIQLFSLACTIKCELPKDEAGIIWDSICFAFLLLQRRVFMSYYFLHVVADIRSSQILAS